MVAVVAEEMHVAGATPLPRINRRKKKPCPAVPLPRSSALALVDGADAARLADAARHAHTATGANPLVDELANVARRKLSFADVARLRDLLTAELEAASEAHGRGGSASCSAARWRTHGSGITSWRVERNCPNLTHSPSSDLACQHATRVAATPTADTLLSCPAKRDARGGRWCLPYQPSKAARPRG